MDARNRNLPEWFNRIRTGQIKLPRFQRFQAWSHSEVASLLETVLRGLPAGAVLTLEVGDSEPFVSRVMEGAPFPTDRCSEHLLDGQQRLTALWRSLNENYPDRSYFVRLGLDVTDNEEEQTSVVAQTRWVRKGVRFPVWSDDPVGTFQRNLVPVKLLRPEDLGTEIQEWCDAATHGDLILSRNLERTILDLRSRVTVYNIPYLALPVHTERHVALEVFIKMNTSAVRLTAFDIVVAQLEETTGESMHDLIDELRQRVPHAEDYRDLGTWVLDTAALREDREPKQASYSRLDLQRLQKDWDEIVDGINWTVQILEEERVFDAKRLPTVAVLPILAALHTEISSDPDATGNARTLLRGYIWRAFVTDRYDRSAGSRSLQDFRGLRESLNDPSNKSMAPIFDEGLFPLPGVDELKAAGWPKNRDILARGVMSLSLRTGARDLADDSTATRLSVEKREYHHIFPDSILVDHGYLTEEESFRALNCVLVTWKTNRKIAAKTPLVYLKERIDAASLGEQALRDRLSSHLVPFDQLAAAGWSDLTDPNSISNAIRSAYENFVDVRAEMVIKAMNELCHGRIPV